MLDINFIRNNIDIVKNAMNARDFDINLDAILTLDDERRKIMTQLQNLQSKHNEIAKKIGFAKGKNEDTKELMQQSEDVKKKIEKIENTESETQQALHDILSIIPNVLQDDVPIGKDENYNKEIKIHKHKPKFDFQPKEHYEIGEKSQLMDFETATKISGSRFVILKGQLAKLERALKNFMLDVHTKEFGYTETSVPQLVNASSMFGTGQLPKFDNGYQTTNGYYLIPTSEVPLTNIVADSIISEEQLPMRFVAYSQCFRSEAGAANKDTRGMLRQHQFSKIELVSISMPEKSKDEHERMLIAVESILQKLDIHYRIALLCSGDTGFCSSKTYDIEVWLPGQNTYREISSCSNTLDFQARRMMARYKTQENKKGYVHTLNGSGLAIGRTMVAIMENYQNPNSELGFDMPEVLKDYFC